MNRKEHWENIYKSKSPQEVSWYQKEPTLSLTLINNLPLKKSAHIIDIGAGASTLCDYLVQDGFSNLTVLDLSSHALAFSQQRLGNKASKIQWVVDDVTTFIPEHSYDVWHDRAVFHFLTDVNDRKKYKHTLMTSVRDGGYVIIAAFSIGGPEKCSGLDIVQYNAEKLQAELGMSFTFIEQQLETHITPGNKEQAFGYYVFKK